MMKAVAALACATIMSGCAASLTPRADGNYATPIGSSAVTDNPTRYSDALACVGARLDPAITDRTTFAVGEVADLTGKIEYYTGRPVTQGATLMAMSALDKMGLTLVERYDIAIPELELRLGNNRLIGDGDGFRPIRAGSITPASFYIVGGITELNYNIHSSSAELGISSFEIGGKFFVLNIGIDLRLIHTETLQVVHVVSYQKQMIGREVRAGVFEFIGDEFVDIGVGERSLEPIHRGVRAAVERAVIDLVGGLQNEDFAGCLPDMPLETVAAEVADDSDV